MGFHDFCWQHRGTQCAVGWVGSGPRALIVVGPRTGRVLCEAKYNPFPAATYRWRFTWHACSVINSVWIGFNGRA